MSQTLRIATAALCVILAVSRLSAQSYDLSWNTIDGGGGTSTGGAFELTGTIGQPDAGPSTTGMSGGQFQLVGGFWPGAGDVCSQPGDLNQDGSVDGDDIQLFVNCLI